MTPTETFDIFWQTYPNDLCNRKGSRKVAEEKYNKIDSETQAQILVNMRELMRTDRQCKKMNEFVPKWPMVSTWLNQARWEDIHDIRQSQDMPIDKTMCSCGEQAEITSKCWVCYDKDQPDKWGLKDEFIKNNLLHQESKEERTKRCKDYLRQKGYLGTVIPDRA